MENDTWYRCTICGREGTVGRCCGEETREPLNDLARAELKDNKQRAEVDRLIANADDCEGEG